MDKIRGVNVGGWLILERWITPSLFEGTDAVDEYTFMQMPGAAKKLERHRKNFIAENDFKWIAGNGLNAIRIPVGYWLLESCSPYLPAVSHLDWAMEMAEKYDVKVLIDLHAAKGSQNGKDHSGRTGAADWYGSRSYRQDTVKVLKRIAERYKNSPALWGIELLNEPAIDLVKYFKLLFFYRNAYREIAPIVRPGTYIVFSDAFVPKLLTGALIKRKNAPVAMDVHWYQFGLTDIDAYFKRLAGKPRQIDCLQRRQPVILGEWSGMLSHETLDGLSEEQQALLQKRHIEEQLRSYEKAAGWFYWTYKTEGGGIWSFRDQVQGGSLLLR